MYSSSFNERFDYDAYGETFHYELDDPSVIARPSTDLLYAGEQWDADLGMQYLRARYYLPAQGIFNRLDPFLGNQEDPQSLHKYAYVHGDPVNGIDPSGMFSLGEMLVTMGFKTTLQSMKVGFAIQFGIFAVKMVALLGRLGPLWYHLKQLSSEIRALPLPSVPLVLSPFVSQPNSPIWGFSQIADAVDAAADGIGDFIRNGMRSNIGHLGVGLLLSVFPIQIRIGNLIYQTASAGYSAAGQFAHYIAFIAIAMQLVSQVATASGVPLCIRVNPLIVNDRYMQAQLVGAWIMPWREVASLRRVVAKLGWHDYSGAQLQLRQLGGTIQQRYGNAVWVSYKPCP